MELRNDVFKAGKNRHGVELNMWVGADGESRTRKANGRRILSALRIPIPSRLHHLDLHQL